jgi:hypothetical protein
MFAEPTIEDFAKLLDWHLDKAANRAKFEYKAIIRRRSAQGLHQSGGTVIEVFEAVHREFETGLKAALGELKRIASKERLDRDELRGLTEDRLRTFMARCKAAVRPEKILNFGPAGPIEERLTKFDSVLAFHLRQFDVGFLDLPEPETPPIMSASIIAGNVSGVAIQQHTAHSTQHVVGKINVDETRSAIAAFEDALREASLLGGKREEVDGDLNTIKAQLSKSSYSMAIITEAGKSLRNLVEGAIANALTPPALSAAAVALWKALGLAQ